MLDHQIIDSFLMVRLTNTFYYYTIIYNYTIYSNYKLEPKYVLFRWFKCIDSAGNFVLFFLTCHITNAISSVIV